MNGSSELPPPSGRGERFGLALLVAVQVAVLSLALTAAYTEPAAYGRSCVNATIARNFYQQGMRFLYPQLDYGPLPGYAALEFPLIPYLAAAVYWLTGVQEWVGRGLAAVFGVGTALAVWGIARELALKPAARLVAVGLVVISPTFMFFSRVFQSDSAMVCACTATAWLLLRARRERGGGPFAAACVACAVGMLLKPSSLVLLPALMSIPLVDRRRGIRRALVVACAAVIPVAVFYLFARTINSYPETVGIDAVVRRASLARMLQFTYNVQIAKDIVQSVTPVGVVAMLVGLPLAVRRRDTWFVPLWALGAAGLDVLFNEALSHHEYYQIIWVPLAALCGGVVISWLIEASALPATVRLAALAAVALLAVGSGVLSWRFIAFRLQFPESAAQRLVAARFVRDHTPPGALVAVEDIDLLYYAERRGWPYGTDTGEAISRAQLESLPPRGLAYVAVLDPATRLSDDARRFLAEQGALVAAGPAVGVWRLAQD